MIRARGIEVHPEGRVVLSGIDLDVAPGEMVAVLGPSGSGKTLLLHSLVGLRRPDSGEVLLQEQSVWNASEAVRHRLRRTVVGFLSQELSLLGRLDPLRNVALPLLLSGSVPEAALEMARGELSRLDLDVGFSGRARRLSRGERQRVALARATVMARPILVLDEPTSSLDPGSQARVMSRIRQKADENVAVLLTTHDRGVASQADRCYRVEAGRLVEAEPKEEPA